MQHVKMKKFLFMDDWTLESTGRFTRQYGQAVKVSDQPLFVPDQRDYEYNNCGYATVLFQPEQGKYTLWYGTSNLYDANTRAIKYLCQAVSDDGISWTRPDLDVVPGTNIVMTPEDNPMGSSIILDRFDPVYPYKLLMRPKYTPAVVGYISRDGIHWQKVSEEPLIHGNSDCKVGLYQDPVTGRYQALFRLNKGHRKNWTSESTDFLHWSRPTLIIEPDLAHGPQTQIYGMQAAYYGAFVIGQSPMYRTETDDLHWAKMRGTMDIETAWSRGSTCWHWLSPNHCLITLGAPGTWDGGMIHPTTAPICLKDEIRFYYSGSSFPHHETGRITSEPQGIGLATLRPDGFVVLACGAKPATLITRPFAIRTPEVYVNADSSRGSLCVEIQDAITGKPIPGYSLDDCIPFSGDSIAQPIAWKPAATRGPIDKRAIRVLVEARDSLLYSLFFPNGNDPEKYWEFDEIGCVDPVRDIGDSDYFMQV